MDDLRTKIDELAIDKRDYVYARSKVKTDRAGYLDAKVSKSAFYSWGEEERLYLNELANRLHSARKFKAEMILDDNVEEAAKIKVEALKSRDERIKQSASTEILDRMLGKPSQGVDVTSGGEKIIVKITGGDD